LIDLCIHLANVLYLISFLGRSMLWLRVLTCAGLMLGLVFFSCQPAPLYGCIVWHLVFLNINAFQIWRLLVEQRALMLSKKQELICEATFQSLSREELLTLLSRVMCEPSERIGDIHQACRQVLTKEEQVLRDIAFSRLSRDELLNLLTRRMWNAIVRLNPMRWARIRKAKRLIAPQDTRNDLA
jgi:hypothetical protein